jgi:hypothetical protein
MVGRSLELVIVFSAGSSEVVTLGDASKGMERNNGGKPRASLAFGVSG